MYPLRVAFVATLLGCSSTPLSDSRPAATTDAGPDWANEGSCEWIVVDGTRVPQWITPQGPVNPGAYAFDGLVGNPRVSTAAAIACNQSTASGSAETPRVPGFHGWRFGMSEDKVREVADCGSYDLASTGDLRCSGFKFEGRPMNVTFTIGPEGLSKIRLSVYEGKSRAKAFEALDWVLAWYARTFGEVAVPFDHTLEYVLTGKTDRKTREAWLLETDGRNAGDFEAQFVPMKQRPELGPESLTFASYMHHSAAGHFVFVYFYSPRK